MCSKTREERFEEVLEVVEEVEDLVGVADKLYTTIVDNRDTTHEKIPTLPLPVSIASLTIMLLKNAIFYKQSGRTRDHRWEIRMSS